MWQIQADNLICKTYFTSIENNHLFFPSHKNSINVHT